MGNYCCKNTHINSNAVPGEDRLDDLISKSNIAIQSLKTTRNLLNKHTINGEIYFNKLNSILRCFFDNNIKDLNLFFEALYLKILSDYPNEDKISLHSFLFYIYPLIKHSNDDYEEFVEIFLERSNGIITHSAIKASFEKYLFYITNELNEIATESCSNEAHIISFRFINNKFFTQGRIEKLNEDIFYSLSKNQLTLENLIAFAKLRRLNEMKYLRERLYLDSQFD